MDLTKSAVAVAWLLLAACSNTQRGESDLARNGENIPSGTKSNAVVGGNNAPAQDAGAFSGGALDDDAGSSDAGCEAATRGCTPPAP